MGGSERTIFSFPYSSVPPTSPPSLPHPSSPPLPSPLLSSPLLPSPPLPSSPLHKGFHSPQQCCWLHYTSLLLHDTNALPRPLGIVPDRAGQESSSRCVPLVFDHWIITAASQPVATPGGLEMGERSKEGEGGEERRGGRIETTSGKMPEQ